jgi:hypothetical protein
MQFALTPSPPSPSPSHFDTEITRTEDETSIIEVAEEDEALDQIERDQQADEVWMSHIREQLSTLFPDFFDPTILGERSEEGEVGEGEVEEEEEMSNLGLSSRSTSGVTSSSSAPSREVSTPVTATMGMNGMSLRGMGVMRGLRGVPSVRDEIGGLRDEIERLRGVVGGLAQNLERDRDRMIDARVEIEMDNNDTAQSVGDAEVVPALGENSEREFEEEEEETELDEVELSVGSNVIATQPVVPLPSAFLKVSGHALDQYCHCHNAHDLIVDCIGITRVIAGSRRCIPLHEREEGRRYL